MKLDNNTTIIVVVAIICVTFILGTVIYLNAGNNLGSVDNADSASNSDSNSNVGLNLFDEKEPMHIINTTFLTEHSLEGKTICTINVGSNHSNENVSVEILYSRQGSNLNDGDKSTKTVGADGSIVCESKDSYSKYPDRAIVTLSDSEGNVLDSADVKLATDDSTQLAEGNGTVTAKSITKAEHSAYSAAKASKSSDEWVEDLDLSDKAGYDCHVYIHHKSDGTKYYIDPDGKKVSAPESEEWVF